MLVELKQLQTSLYSVAASAESRLPPSVQEHLHSLTEALSSQIVALREIAVSERPVSEKVGAIIVEVREGVNPLLGKVGEAVGVGKAHVVNTSNAASDQVDATVNDAAQKAGSTAKAAEAKVNESS